MKVHQPNLSHNIMDFIYDKKTLSNKKLIDLLTFQISKMLKNVKLRIRYLLSTLSLN